MNELLDFLKEHLWLFFWIVISIFSAIGEAKKKKREAELGGDAPDWTPPEGDVIPPPELELETVQPQTEAVIPFESFERKLRAYEKATEKRPELLSVNRLLREEVRPEQMRRWEAEGRPSALHLSHPLKRWLEEQLSSVEFIISSRVRGRAEDLKLVEAVAREALAPFETFVRAQGVDYRRRSLLAIPGQGGIPPSALPVHLIPAPPGASHQPLLLPLSVAALGEQIHHAVRGLEEDFARGLHLPRELPALDDIRLVSAEYLRAAHGPALGAIFGDLYAIGLYGAAYGEALLFEIERRRDPAAAFTYSVHGWRVHGLPLALRFLIALRAIEREDGAKEAGALRARFQAFTGSVEVYRLADRRGVVGQIPRHIVESITEEIAPQICAFRHPSLDGLALGHIPGLGFSVARQRRIDAAVEALAHGAIPSTSLGEAVAAAARLAGPSRDRSQVLAELLRRMHRGERSSAQRRQARHETAAGERPFKELLSDRNALRDAVALGAILTPRRPR